MEHIILDEWGGIWTDEDIAKWDEIRDRLIKEGKLFIASIVCIDEVTDAK